MALNGTFGQPPRQLGPYTLLRRIAIGGMAEVYVASARGVGGFEKLVAIKVIHPRYSEDQHFIQLLVEEAKICVVLNHHNVAQVFDLGRVDRTFFIVMEYVDGPDAYRLMQRAKNRHIVIPVEISLFIAQEMCQGLDYAHRKQGSDGEELGIVHRDISPQNVLISHGGEVKLVDFGIAKATLRSEQTQVGVIKGKYCYMSPEQASGRPTDHRSDVFSVGVVLYELLVGEMLYRKDSIPVLLDSVRRAEVVAPSRRRPELPPELDRILLKALARNPDDRYPTARAFGNAITDHLNRIAPQFTASRISSFLAELFPEERPQSASASEPSITAKRREVSETTTLQQPQNYSETQSTIGVQALPVMRAEDFPLRRSDSVIFPIAPYLREAATPVLPPSSTDTFDEWDRPPRADVARNPPRHQPNAVYDDATEVSDEGESDWSQLEHPTQQAAELLQDAADHDTRRVVAPEARPKPTPRSMRAIVHPSASIPAPRITVAPPRRLGQPLPSPVFFEPAVAIPAAASTSTHRPASDWPTAASTLPPAALAPPEAWGHQEELSWATLTEKKRHSLRRPGIVGFAVAIVVVMMGIVLYGQSKPNPALEIVSVPAGATVHVDEKMMATKTPLRITDNLDLSRPYHIRLHLDGYDDWETTFQPTESLVTQIAVLRPTPALLRVETTPAGGQVWVDGTFFGTSPIDIDGLSVGRVVDLRISRTGYADERRTLRLDEKNRHPRLHLMLRPLLRHGRSTRARN